MRVRVIKKSSILRTSKLHKLGVRLYLAKANPNCTLREVAGDLVDVEVKGVKSECVGQRCDWQLQHAFLPAGYWNIALDWSWTDLWKSKIPWILMMWVSEPQAVVVTQKAGRKFQKVFLDYQRSQHNSSPLTNSEVRGPVCCHRLNW